MSAYIWGAWGTEWALSEKVSFNGLTKKITVNAGVTSLDIATDVYSAWVRWTGRERQYLPAMRYSGYDPIPGGRTGATFFLVNGWKLVIDFNLVSVSGVLYSENYGSAYWSASDLPLYPATVAALVNSSISYQNVVTGDLGSVATAAEIATQVRATLAAELTKILELAQLHGLISPLVVSETSRSSGSITQEISTVGGVTTVTRTA